MSGLGTALSAAVQGFVDGRNVRNAWDDRKDEKKRQARRDAILDAQELRAQQSHDMSMTAADLLNQSRRQEIRQSDQAWADNQDLRGALRTADTAAIGGLRLGSTPDEGGGANPQPVAPPALAFPVDDRAQSIQENAAGQPGPISAAMGSMPPGPTRAEAGPALFDDRAQSISENRTGAPPPRTYSFADWQGMSREQRKDADLPTSQIGGQMYFDRLAEGMGSGPAVKAGRTDQARIEADQAAAQPQTPFQADLQAAGRGLSALGSGIKSTASLWAEQALNAGSDALDTINAPFRAAGQYLTGADPIGPASRADINGDGKNTSVVSPYFDLMRPAAETPEAARAALDQEQGAKTAPASVAEKPATPAKKPEQSAAETGATRAMEAVGNSPAQQAAANATPLETLGSGRGRPMTVAQRDKLAQTYTQSWRENGAPIIMRELLKQGRVEDAQKFDNFVRSQKAQEGMDLWMKGVVAAHAGDVDTAAESLMDAYNSQGYFDDGYQVVKDKTSLIKDDTGAVVGINLTMRHEATGETFTQSDTIEGFTEKAIWITSPEKAFEAELSKQKLMQQQLIEAQKDRQKTATSLIVKDYEAQQAAIENMVKVIADQQKDSLDPNAPKLSPAEIRQRATEAVMGGGAGDGLPDDTPVLRAPR